MKELSPKELVQKAKEYGIRCHKNVNHLYGNKPYSFHLQMAADYVKKYEHLAPKKNRHYCEAGIWVHDVPEDTRQTYNDVKKELGEDIADIAFALQNEKGKTRKERANNKYYSGIRRNEYAHFDRLCDRLANIRNSAINKHSMIDVYREEQPEFERQLFKRKKHEPMFREMRDMLNGVIHEL